MSAGGETRGGSAVTALQFWAVLRRELSAYFLSPMSYLVWAVFLVGAGYLFATSIRDGAPASLSFTFTSLEGLLLFVAPLLTMRLVAEELKQGTLESLMTDPVSETVVILAKYGASIMFFFVLLSPTLAYPMVLSGIAQPDPGPILSGYLALVLTGCLFLAVGLLTSALTANQIAAATLSFTILLVFWILGWAADSIGPGTLREVLDYLSTFTRFAPFRRGVVDTRAVIYVGSLTVLSLFLAVRCFALRRLR